jgi:hypothetical protein
MPVWILLFLYGSRTGFDGDSVALLSGILHFDARGPQNVYRYYWQPLGYDFFSALLRLGMPVNVFFLMPAFAGAASVTMLSVAAYRESSSWVIALGSLLLLPELLNSSLFFNPTILGAVPFVGAILVARSSLSLVARGIAVGGLAAAAVCFRLDYLLALPLLVCWLVTGSNTRAAVACFLTFVIFMLLVMAAGLIAPMQVVAVLGEFHGDTRTWTVRDNMRVISTLTLTLGALGVATILSWPRRINVDLIAWIVAACVAALPFLALQSPKYALPGLLFAPLFIAHSLGRVAYQRDVRTALIAVLAVAYLAPAGALKGTQDGDRVRYGYLAWWSGPDGPRMTMPIWAAFQRRLAESVADFSGCTRVYPTDPAAWGGEWMVWTWPTVYLEHMGFKARQYSLVAGIDLVRGSNQVVLYPNDPGPSPHCRDVKLPRLDGTWFEVRDRLDAFWVDHSDLSSHAQR